MGFEHLMIIGSGCEEFTAAIYVGRANLDPLVIEGDQRGGQLIRTTNVRNFPGFPEDINGFDLMSNMRVQAAKIGTRFRSGVVERIDLKEKTAIDEGDRIESRAVTISTGASPRILHIPGEEDFFGGKA
jgi:thioredoxin reductase (NADPH)